MQLTLTNKIQLLLLCIVVMGANVFKPYHIDDTFHLLAAEHIADKPAHFMVQKINWANDPNSLHQFNQPPGFFMLIAPFSILSEPLKSVVLHFFTSIFSVFVIYFFLKIQNVLYQKISVFSAAIMVLSAVFLVNQNVMTDMPLLAMIMAFIYYAINYFTLNTFSSGLFCMLFLSAAMLIKYTALPLIVVFLIIALFLKKYKALWFASIPFTVLLIWSLSNYFQFGFFHIMGRASHLPSFNDFITDKIPLFFMCIGTTWPFVLLLKSKSMYFKVYLVYSLGSLLFYLLFPVFSNSVNLGNQVLVWIFRINGFLFLLSFVFITIQILWKPNNIKISWPSLFIFLNLIGLSIFIMLFAPFMASRHVLLVLPLYLLLVTPFISSFNKRVKILLVLHVFAIGLAVLIADFKYAASYKLLAQKCIQTNYKNNSWAIGHWGWQYYALEKKCKTYGTFSSKPQMGDILYSPISISKQEFNHKIKLDTIGIIPINNQNFMHFSVSNFANMYICYWNKPSWQFADGSSDTLLVFRIIQTSN